MSFCFPAWKNLTNDKFILDAIQGYELEFVSNPVQRQLPRELIVSVCEQEAIDNELLSLLRKGVIQKCGHEPGEFISHIFARPKPNGSLRVILNLKELNQFLKYEHFKMEHLSQVLNLVYPLDWFCSIDLKDAYFAILVAPHHRKYLKFYWKKQLFSFSVLCFGLATAPRLFTRICKPVLRHLRGDKNFRMSIYIDDIILMNQDKSNLIECVNYTLSFLESLGFTANFSKSVVLPTRIIKHLGFLIDSVQMELKLPEDKALAIKTKCEKVLNSRSPSIRLVASLVGTLTASCQATKWGRLFYRKVEQEKISALKHKFGDFDSFMTLSDLARNELSWWLTREHVIASSFSVPKATLTLFSDASLLGWGAYDGSTSAGGRWTPDEQSHHINWLELKACWLSLQTFAKGVSRTCIAVHLDNTTAISYIINQGGKVAVLNELVNRLWHWCKQRDLWLLPNFIKGKLNTTADQRSRCFHDPTEWSLVESVFVKAVKLWGFPDVDLFASRINNKVPKYCSWEPDPMSFWVNAFNLNWNQFNLCYIFPPFSLISAVMKKITEDKAEAILVVPNWPTQMWFPLIKNCLANVDIPIFHVPNSKETLWLPYKPDAVHPIWNKLDIICCRISGNAASF